MFQVEHSVDDVSFVVVRNALGDVIEFTGNADQSTKQTNTLPEGIAARYVRVVPVTWSGQAAMRVTLQSCVMPRA